MTRYDWLYLAAAPLVLPAVGYKRLTRGKYRESLPGMLGRGPQWGGPAIHQQGSLWIHSVSAGEVTAAKAVAPLLQQTFPHLPLIASTTTETGQAAAKRSLTEAEEVFYYPLDLSWNVAKFFRRFRPKAVVLLEAEIWPNFLRESDRNGTKVFLINGRVSERTYRRYQGIGRFMAEPLRQLTAFCMQTKEDAERLERTIGCPEKIFVTGNVKFDVEFPTLEAAEKEEWLRRLGLSHSSFITHHSSLPSPILVVGSTHPGEEEIVLDAFARVKAAFPQASMILAPRHPERFNEVGDLLQKRNIPFSRASQAASGNLEPRDVVLFDVMGQLARAYGLGDVAIVGGSFVPIGGHNLLEANAHSIPVVFGPHMHRQPDMLRLVGQQGGGIQVDGENLGATLIDLLRNPEKAAHYGTRGRQCIDENRGSAMKSVEIVRRFMENA